MFSLLTKRASLRVSSSFSQRSSGAALVLLAARLPTDTRLFSASTYQGFAAVQSATKTSSAAKSNPKTSKTSTKAKTGTGKPKTTKAPAKIRISRKDRPPTGPRSSFMLFNRDYYKQHGPINTREGLIELTKASATQWKALPQSERERYLALAREDNIRFEKDMAEYVGRVDPRVLQAIDDRRKSKGITRLRMPRDLRDSLKRPNAPFSQYVKEKYHATEVPSDMAPFERSRWVIKQLSEQWNKLSAEEKEPYFKDYRERRAEYDELRAKKMADH